MKILLVQTSFLGDTILSTPVIGALRRRYPSAEIRMMVTPKGAELVRGDPRLNGIIIDDKRGSGKGVGGLLGLVRNIQSHQFDVVYSLHRSYRTAIALWLSRIPRRVGFSSARLSFLYSELRDRPPAEHDVLRNLSLLSGETTPTPEDDSITLFPPPIEACSPAVREIVDDPRGYIVLVPGSAWATKRWMWQGYREAGKHFAGLGKRVVVLGDRSEAPITGKVCEGTSFDDCAGKVSLPETLVLISRAGLVVCNDSMALHCASGFGTPSVAVFCATSPAYGFGPWKNERGVVVEKLGLPCKPCARHGGHVCPTGTNSCMRDLPASEVITAGERMMERSI